MNTEDRPTRYDLWLRRVKDNPVGAALWILAPVSVLLFSILAFLGRALPPLVGHLKVGSAGDNVQRSIFCYFTKGPHKGEWRDYPSPLLIGTSCESVDKETSGTIIPSAYRKLKSTLCHFSGYHDDHEEYVNYDNFRPGTIGSQCPDAEGNTGILIGPERSTTCYFTSGLRRGETDSFSENPIGTPCWDQKRNKGIIVPGPEPG
jgi:hypothetical protein